MTPEDNDCYITTARHCRMHQGSWCLKLGWKSDRHWFTRNYLIGKATLQLSYINKRQHHLCPPRCQGTGVGSSLMIFHDFSGRCLLRFGFRVRSRVMFPLFITFQGLKHLTSAQLSGVHGAVYSWGGMRGADVRNKRRGGFEMVLKAFQHSLTTKNRGKWVIRFVFFWGSMRKQI